jgi:hypothetical protein
MKTLWSILLLLSLAPAVDAAAAPDAVVAEVDPRGNVVLDFDGTLPGGAGDEIELTYRAGLMDMLLGRYRIVSVQGRRVEARAMSISAPPSKGMRVMVTAAQAVPLPADSRAASPAAGASREGRVVDVQGRAAEIEFPSGIAVGPGDRFSLAFEAPRVGRVAIQGTWRVTSVTGNRAHAEPDGATGQPRVGQVAILGHAGARQQLDALGQTAPPADRGRVRPGWIGLRLQALTPDLAQTLKLPPDTQGSLVADVEAGGPAQQSGLRPEDVILEIDGEPAVMQRLVGKVRQSAPGTLMRLRVWRQGSRMFLALRVGQAP